MQLLPHSAIIKKLSPCWAVKHKQGGASIYGEMSVLRQGRVLWYSGLTFPQTFQSYMEAQCEARQGHRGRKSQARLRMHSLPAQRQGHPRCVILILPETSSPYGELFSFFPYRCDASNSRYYRFPTGNNGNYRFCTRALFSCRCNA